MILKKWNELPKFMQLDEVKPYYDYLVSKRISLILKRFFDVFFSIFLLILFLPVFFIVSMMIVIDSPGGVFYKQERITQYGKKFYIHKFRTMVANADQVGSSVTVNDDCRVTKVGKMLRKYRIDEFPQLIDVLKGDMTFVGTRPEVVKYVKKYKPEMIATLLLPAGITSRTSILYKDEFKMLTNENDVDSVYINKILPEKMKFNLNNLMEFNFGKDFCVMLSTIRYLFV